MKCAFVASGGGLKAYAFHLGVMKALEAHGFRRMLSDEKRHAPLNRDEHGGEEKRIDCYIGSSAGAFFATACVFVPGLDEMRDGIGIGPGKRKGFSVRDTLMRHLSVLTPSRGLSGIFGAEGMAALAKGFITHDDFRKVGPELFICATQLNASRKVIFGPKDSANRGRYDRLVAYYNDVPISDAIAASSCVPFMFRPYSIRNQAGSWVEYLDGEVRETLSMHIAHECDVELVISSNTWMPYQYHADIGSLAKQGFGAILNQVIAQASEQKVDNFLNEGEKFRETLAAIDEFGKWEGLSEEQIANLKGQISLTLNQTPIEQLYIAPDRDDAEFNLMPSFSITPKQLEQCIDRGFERTERALAIRAAGLPIGPVVSAAVRHDAQASNDPPAETSPQAARGSRS